MWFVWASCSAGIHHDAAVCLLTEKWRKWYILLFIGAIARWICTLRELCTTFNMAHHNPYECGLHDQTVLRAYTMMLQCVYSRKSDENGIFYHLGRYFTLEAPARWLCTLRELCTTFKMAYHNSYKCDLHDQTVLRAYTMMLHCVSHGKVTKMVYFTV